MDNPAAPIPSTSPQPAVEPEVSTPAESQPRRWFLWLIGGLIILTLGAVLGVFGVKFLNQSTAQSQVSSYEDCLTAKGSLVQRSYPATCVTDYGQRFVQPLTDEEKQGLQPPDLYREPAGSAAAADWKTYFSSKYSYSFRYPPNWYINPELSDAQYGITSVSNYDFKSQTSPKDGVKIEINFIKVPANERKEFINQRLENYKNSSFVSNPTYVTQGVTTIGNLPTEAIKLLVNSDKSYTEEFIAFPNNTMSIVVSRHRTHLEEKIVDQILSTFKFTN